MEKGKLMQPAKFDHIYFDLFWYSPVVQLFALIHMSSPFNTHLSTTRHLFSRLNKNESIQAVVFVEFYDWFILFKGHWGSSRSRNRQSNSHSTWNWHWRVNSESLCLKWFTNDLFARFTPKSTLLCSSFAWVYRWICSPVINVTIAKSPDCL